MRVGKMAIVFRRAQRSQTRLPLPCHQRFGWRFLSTTQPTKARLLKSSRQGLAEIGAVDGKNVAIEYRWARDEYDRLRALATELVQRRGRSTCSARV